MCDMLMMVFLSGLPGSQQHPDSAPELGEDAVMSAGASSPPPALTEEERRELQEELVKVRKHNEIQRSWFRESGSGDIDMACS